jgi:M6 family metalloprotease-like protein
LFYIKPAKVLKEEGALLIKKRLHVNKDRLRKQFQVLFLFIFLLVINHTALGVAAYPFPVEITQPDGTKITIIQRGDEFVKWAQTVDGYSIMRNSNKIYEYVKLDANRDMVPSGIAVRNLSERSASDLQFLMNTPKGLTYSTSQMGMMKSISAIQKSGSERTFPTTGARKLICILIGFTDKAFTKTKTDFENLFNQVGYAVDGANGSVSDYYKENSYNQLNLAVTVAGPYMAAHNMAYYGANDANGHDVNPGALISEAILLADPTVDFTQFDNDNDGTVDEVCVIYAGYGEEYTGVSPDAIWAQASAIAPIPVDGKTASRYSATCELRGNSGTGFTRIGVICHEFGHVLGARDYYDSDNATNGQYDGTGRWDLMGNGNWNNNGITPAHHNPYTKIFDYNWASATTLTTGSTILLNNAEQNSNSFYRINTATAGEFFLIENRQQQKFDSFIPGHGMIIYRVDKTYIDAQGNLNVVNSGSHQRMYPVCANATGNPPTDYGVINNSGMPFPGSSNVATFTDATTPNMLSWVGASTNKPITNITENIGNLSVSFGFAVNPTAPTTTAVAASSITTTVATLNGVVSSNYAGTTVSFEYGLTTSYGSSISGTPNIVNSDSPATISAALTGLIANTTYNYRVKAVNAIGTSYSSNMTFTTLAVSTVILTLPVTENFNGSTLPAGWSTQNVGSGITERWSLSNTNKAGGTANELKCAYEFISTGTTRIITPAINTIGVSGIVMSFKHLFEDFDVGATLKIQSSKDLVNWTNEAWSLASKSAVPVGPETINTTVSNNLNSATTFIAFVVEGNLFQFNYWYIDNLSLIIAPTTSIPTVTTTVASVITSSTASSGGNVTADGGAAVTAKGVCWSTTANPTIALSAKTVNGTGTGLFTSNITGLNSGNTYHVRAYATNSIGTAYGTDLTFTTTNITAPLANAASSVFQTSFTANWSASSGATGYLLDVATDNAFTSFLTGYSSKDLGNILSFNVTGLSAKTTYYYRVRAYNSGGTSVSSNIIASTTLSVIPTTPTALSVTGCNSLVTLKWKKSVGADIRKYRIYGGISTNPIVKIDSTTNGVSDTLKVISGLIKDQTYYFRVSAVNLDGAESAFSNQVFQKVIKGVVPRITTKWGEVLICSNIGDSISGYQWYKGGIAIPFAIGQYYSTNKVGGIYTVEATDRNGCKSFSNSITIVGTKSLTIFPNPTAVNFSIKVNDKPEGKAFVTVINSGGINVVEFETDVHNNELLKEISVSNLNPGIYVVRVMMDHQEAYYTKVVVIK